MSREHWFAFVLFFLGCALALTFPKGAPLIMLAVLIPCSICIRTVKPVPVPVPVRLQSSLSPPCRRR